MMNPSTYFPKAAPLHSRGLPVEWRYQSEIIEGECLLIRLRTEPRDGRPDDSFHFAFDRADMTPHRPPYGSR